jgi:Lanthionine synthetase C-like protein
MLYTPEAHEPLLDEPWSADAARAAVAAIVRDTEDAFDDGWLVHPDDDEGDLSGPRPRTLYLGGAGVVAALHRLAARGHAELRRDYARYLEDSVAWLPDFPDEDVDRSLLAGEPGVRLVLQRLAPSAANLERLAELIAANEQDERCELMWGSPGTILAARELGFDVSSAVAWLLGRRDADGLWTQPIGSKPHRHLGPMHGFAGCALALGDAVDVSETLRPLAFEEDGLVNWSPVAELGLREANRDGQIRMQWCHGAPGIVGTLGDRLDEDLALGGGELTWRAGPLVKGPGLCHGTAGNGYALLALHERTGDELWLVRARAFAMHAIAQVERSRAESGRRYSLWTGDLGVAVYLADCVDGGGRIPLP